MNNIKMTSGFGQFHTNEPDPAKPDKKLTTYLTIGYADICKIVDKPPSVPKAQAQWLIPSILPSRSFKEQEELGKFFMLWADLDDHPPTLPDLAVMVESIIGDSDYEIYNTSSAMPDNQKARILIPLSEPLRGADWMLAQQTLNDKLEALGIKPDRASERPAQLCYLPNKGKFYGSRYQRDGIAFNPLTAWAKEITAKRDELEAERIAHNEAKNRATERRAALTLDSAPDIYAAFNSVYTCDYWLEQAGYCRNSKGEYRHPNSETGNFSATIKDGRVNTRSSSDPLFSAGQGAHDAFGVFTILMHNGDKAAALKDAGNNLLTIGCVPYNKAVQIEYAKKQAGQQPDKPGQVPDKTEQKPPQNDDIDYSTMPDYADQAHAPMAKVTPTSTFNATLDTEHKYCTVDLLSGIDENHILKRLSIQTAAETHLPVNTVFLMGMTVFSSMVARKYAVQYQNEQPLPIGLYSVVEQPSGTGKSWCLGIFQKPFIEIQKEVLKEVLTKISRFQKRIDDGDEPLAGDEQAEHKELAEKATRLSTGLFVTNATPEGLEMTLSRTSGFFSAVSSEQGLFNSLLGNSYKSDNSSNNNDVVLNGFDGGHVNSVRVTRKGYNGNVIGAVACFAQQGSIETVLKASNGTGLSERFLMLAEPHSLGKRDHTKQAYHDRNLVNDYANACKIIESVISEPLVFESLNNLTISKAGFLKINQYRNSIEPHLIDGGRFSHISLRGAASKINMQIMKIAAILHLSDYAEMNNIIPERHINAAIHIANELLEANLKLCKDKGIMGVKAEFTAIINYLTAKHGVKSERDIINSMRTTQPFKDFSGSQSTLIKSTLAEMIVQRLLTQTWDTSGKSIYSLAQ
jgi:hypothetical protein